MTDPTDLVHEAMFAAAQGDSALSAKLRDGGGRLGWFTGRIPAAFRLSDTVAAVTVEGMTSLRRGDKEEVTITLSVTAQRHGLAKAVDADLLRLFHPSGGNQWKPLALPDGHVGFGRREFADWSNDRDSEVARRNLRFRVLVARPRAA